MNIFTNISRHGWHPAATCLACCAIILFCAHTASGDKREIIVEINGVRGEMLDNIRASLSLMNSRETENCNEAWLKHLYARSTGEIISAMEPFGYYNPGIQSRVDRTGEKLVFTFDITPGPKVIIDAVDIKLYGPGANEPALKKMIMANPFHKGDEFDQDMYEEWKESVIRRALDLGYGGIKNVKHIVTVDRAGNSASVTLYFDTGPLYHFGRVECCQEIISHELMRRYTALLQPGELYSQAPLQKLQSNLITSGYFSLVEVKPMFSEASGDTVPVRVRVLPAKRHRFSIGGGYDTRTGMNGMVRWQNIRVNRYGHSSDLILRLSRPRSVIKGTYWIPVLNPATDRTGISGSLEREITDNTERRTADIDLGWYFERGGWRSSLFSELKYEHFRTGDEPWKKSVLFSSGVRTSFTHFARDAFPRSGWALETDFRGSPGIISDTAYCRWDTTFRALLPIPERGRLNMRLRTGFAWVDIFSNYPTSLRFFAGGDESVRGYGWKELGPENSDGDVEGGKNMLAGSIEYDYRMFDEWVAAIFVDGGNAFNNSIDRLYIGAGAGARWLSPAGAVRFDCAWPMNERGRGPKLSSIHFYFGFELTM